MTSKNTIYGKLVKWLINNLPNYAFNARKK